MYDPWTSWMHRNIVPFVPQILANKMKDKLLWYYGGCFSPCSGRKWGFRVFSSNLFWLPTTSTTDSSCWNIHFWGSLVHPNISKVDKGAIAFDLPAIWAKAGWVIFRFSTWFLGDRWFLSFASHLGWRKKKQPCESLCQVQIWLRPKVSIFSYCLSFLDEMFFLHKMSIKCHSSL